MPLGDRQAVRASLCSLAALPVGARPGKLRPAEKEAGLSAEQNQAPPGSGEFVARVALMISLVALSIDAMLPALPAIGAELGVRQANDAQLVISALFLGLAIAQMVYGPLSDSFGRKPAIYAGFAIFIAGCVLSILASGLEVMLLGRFLQGIGAAGPRIVTMALVRDQYAGRAMARVMSLAMAVFIMVPVLAPAIGQGILLVAHWRAIFGMLLAVALIALAWFALRQPETLPPARRTPFSLRGVAAARARDLQQSRRVRLHDDGRADLRLLRRLSDLRPADLSASSTRPAASSPSISACWRRSSAPPCWSTRAWSWSGACSSCAASR